MNRISKLYLAALFSLLLVVSGCAKVPITGRSQLNLVPDSMMNSMALQSYREFVAQNKLSDNAEQTQMVKRVGGRIRQAVEQYSKQNDLSLEGYEWEFNLVEDEAKNAWAMPVHWSAFFGRR